MFELEIIWLAYNSVSGNTNFKHFTPKKQCEKKIETTVREQDLLPKTW